jgi:bifunctional UDP-N-acetylglucosamine pyrophosphorylase/glucosamine-1-phosphate N-acetyltransferase
MASTEIKKHVIIMAGGSGSRMKSSLPKQILDIHNKPMLIHIIDQIIDIKKEQDMDIILVLSQKNKDVILDNLTEREFFFNSNNKYFYNNTLINIVIQDTKNYKGTGGAIMACENFFMDYDNTQENHVLVLSADVPLISKKTILSMFDNLIGKKACVLTKDDSNNYGYGRVIGKFDGSIEIIEHKDCNEEQLKITIINTGIYSFEMSELRKALSKLNKNNSQNELYLTDTIQHIDDVKIVNYVPKDYDETLGANTQEQLEELRKNFMIKMSCEE